MRTKAFAVLALCAMLPSCAHTYREGVLKRAKEKGWNEEQQLAALYHSYLYFAKEGENGKLTVLYSRLPIKDVREQLDQRLKDLADILDYKNEGANQYLKTFGLRQHFEHQEEIFKAIRARVRVAELDDVFKRLVGERGFGYGSEQIQQGYDPTILSETDMAKKFPFTSKTVEEAKAKGLLSVVETFTVHRTAKYDHKEPDPAYPDDQNKFIWRSKDYFLEVTKYKVQVAGETPNDNFGNYVEGYRIVDGKKESKPALRAFLEGHGGYAVAVIDADQEKKVIGFGLPDFVEQVPEGSLVSEGMVTRLYPDEPASHRIERPLPPIRMEIARIGEPTDVWEKAPDAKGFLPPSDYQVGPLYDNYNVRLKFVEPKKEHHSDADVPKGLRVEYIIKEYTAPGQRYQPSKGQVVEYYKPKKPYDGPYLAAKVAESESTKKLVFVALDGTEESGYVVPLPNKYIDKPASISFKLGEKWWLIQDDDGDGIYEKRRETSTPKYQTGVYEGSVSQQQQEASHSHDAEADSGEFRQKNPEPLKPDHD